MHRARTQPKRRLSRLPMSNLGAAIPDRAPLRPGAFLALPLGAVRPAGWLRRQLELQGEGLTGHLGEIWSDVGPNSNWLGGTGENWERGPYYADGLVPLAFLLGEPGLLDLAQRWVDWSLASQTPDGFFGPATNDDWWPRMVMLKALIQYQEATADPRVIPFLERYFAHQRAHLPNRPLAKWGWVRGAENVLSVFWLYHRTGDPALLNLAELLVAQTLDWGSHFVEFPYREKYTTGFEHRTHVVNVAMGIKEPALRYVLTGDVRWRDAVTAAFANLDRYHGQATGMFSGDEWLAGRDPSQGVELCAVVELMFSLEHLIRIFGDVAFADRLERIAYNNLPATITSDLRAHQYDQQWNQVQCTIARRNWTDNGDDSNIFGLEPNFGCCTANLHQGWPKLTASLWLATPDGGLAAAAYAPCEVSVSIGGVAVTIAEETSYPFDDTVTFRVQPATPVTFPLVLRVPAWATGASATVNGESQSSFNRPGFVTIRREWRLGDLVELRLPSPIRAERRPTSGIAIQRGPLTFALAIGEDWRKLPAREGRTEPFADWEVYPTTPWNYALALDPADPERSVTLDRGPIESEPFARQRPPVRLRVKARRVPEWSLVDNSAGPVPASPVAVDTPPEEVTLVPYGCARLRVTELPYTATAT
jgi:hypothetical protein